MYIAFKIITLVTLVILDTDGIQVTVTRTNKHNDVILFHQTTNKRICEEYKAYYITSSRRSVSCQCYSPSSSFYSVTTRELPQCHSGNANKFGCSSCNKNCISNITTHRNSFRRKIKPDEYLCSDSRKGKYDIEQWDGKTWISFFKSNDFKIDFDADLFWFQWDRLLHPEREILAYSGHIFLITAYCGEYKIGCFLATADGQITYDIQDPQSSKHTGLIVGITFGVGIPLAFILIYVYYKRRRISNVAKNIERFPSAAPTVTPTAYISTSYASVLTPTTSTLSSVSSVINNPSASQSSPQPLQQRQFAAWSSQEQQYFMKELHPPQYTTEQTPQPGQYTTHIPQQTMSKTQIFSQTASPTDYLTLQQQDQ